MTLEVEFNEESSHLRIGTHSTSSQITNGFQVLFLDKLEGAEGTLMIIRVRCFGGMYEIIILVRCFGGMCEVESSAFFFQIHPILRLYQIDQEKPDHQRRILAGQLGRYLRLDDATVVCSHGGVGSPFDGF
ncbi:hypothetical protein LXL04_019466 [Taraxacum kok-saghyz]